MVDIDVCVLAGLAGGCGSQAQQEEEEEHGAALSPHYRPHPLYAKDQALVAMDGLAVHSMVNGKCSGATFLFSIKKERGPGRLRVYRRPTSIYLCLTAAL